MRFKLFLTITLITVGLLFAACTTTADDAADDEPVDTDDSTEVIDDANDDEALTDERLIQEIDDVEDVEPGEQVVIPEKLWLVGETGEQDGWPVSYFWVEPEGMLGLRIDGHYVPLHDEPLQVQQGETLQLNSEVEDELPESIIVRVYPREGNFAGEHATRWGERDAFYPETDPVAEDDVDPTELSWTVDLDEGEYFIMIETEWHTPEEYPEDVFVDFGYWIIVG